MFRFRIGPYPLTPGEVSGALGDLGVLIPLEAALIAVNGLNPTSTLLGAGIAYIAAGWYFRLPMPVQPLKAMSAIAIAHQVSPSVIAAGALLMSICLFGLVVTRAVDYLSRVFPLPVVRGVQLALGIILIKSGIEMVLRKSLFIASQQQSYVALAGLEIPLGLLIGLGSLLLMLVLLWRPLLPAAFMVALMGVIIGITIGEGNQGFNLGPAAMSFSWPSLGDLPTALTLLVIPQLPLSLTNSVVATVDATRTYYGEQARRVTPSKVSLSFALGNLWAGLVGGLPMCHGSGGVTAHYRMGARTPAASTVIGGLLILIAVLFGQSATQVRSLMPYAVLGALLLYVGVQHFILGLKIRHRFDLAIVGVVAGVSVLPFGNLALGATAGLAAYWLGHRIGAWKQREAKAP